MIFLRCVCFFCFLIITSALQATEEIELMYVERHGNPDVHDSRYFFAQIAEIVEAVFAVTGDDYMWQKFPVGRIVRAIEQDDHAACAVGWYRNEEREKIGKFTTTVAELQPMGAIARRDAGLKDYYEHITDLIFDTSMVGGTIKLSESTPSHTSALINQYGDNVSVLGFSVGTADLLRMVQIGHIHYMLISGDEADFYLSNPEWGSEIFQKIRFGNFTELVELALFCTKTTPDDWIERFNAAFIETQKTSTP